MIRSVFNYVASVINNVPIVVIDDEPCETRMNSLNLNAESEDDATIVADDQQMAESSDAKEFDNWDNEWDAMRHKVKDLHRAAHLPLSTDVSGVITFVDHAKREIIINRTNKCVYDKCTYGDPETNDVVRVGRLKEGSEVLVNPLRYKCFTGKITGRDESTNRLIFSNHAFIRITPKTAHLRENEVIKCIVIENNGRKYNWRAIPVQYNHVEETDDTDKYINELLENKHEIQIDSDISFGVIKLGNRGIKSETLIEAVNEHGELQIDIDGVQVMEKFVVLPYQIKPGHECRVSLTCHAKYRGDNSQLIQFNFEGFKIGRFLSVTVMDYESSKWSYANNVRGQMIAAEEMKHLRRRLFGQDIWTIKGEPIWPGTKHLHTKIANYQVPEQMWDLMQNAKKFASHYEILKQPLSMTNYAEHFHTLIYLEECQNHINLVKYNLKNVTMKHERAYLALEIPGLAEGRPSLIINDKVLVNRDGDDTKYYEGFIHHVRKDDVLIKFHSSFHEEYNGECYNVIFMVNRILFRRCHYSIDLSRYVGAQVLFPDEVILKKPMRKIAFHLIDWFNESLNSRQKLSVIGVLRGECRPTPYMIFGPPGTGKTITIVECILQVFTKLKHSRIIACTVANSSADLIARKLLESGVVTATDLIRISAAHRIPNSVPEDLRGITSVAVEDEQKWLYHRIIVTTSCQSGVIYRYKVASSHFTHVFIDEAAQITEPEILIPISLSAVGYGCIVLAGDPLQLGPVVTSNLSKHYKYDVSLMERLMSLSLYARNCVTFGDFGGYNPKFITKLIMNYRSDAQIMKISSQMFYDSELEFNVLTDTRLLSDLGLPMPMVFHAVSGTDQRSDDSPSWFNYAEILMVEIYLNRLINCGVDMNEMSIITPYRKQLEMIRRRLEMNSLPNVKVATIEEFQGDERRVIILSTVRSSEKNLDHDVKFNLGFVFNAKRFNVAVSRAMNLLIVIGDPKLLSRDQYWAKYIEHCRFNNSCYGCS